MTKIDTNSTSSKNYNTQADFDLFQNTVKLNAKITPFNNLKDPPKTIAECDALLDKHLKIAYNITNRDAQYKAIIKI